MGYYTYYDLKVKNVDTEEKFKQIVSELEQKNIIRYALEDGEYNPNQRSALFVSSDCRKWYECENDMSEISKKIPECVFVLYGQGEENGDLWCEHFENGSYERVYVDDIDPETVGEDHNNDFYYLIKNANCILTEEALYDS